MRRLLPLLLVALVVAAAALAANLLVLEQAGGADGPVGTLSPVQPALTSRPAPRPAEQPRTRRHHEEEDD